MIDLLAGNSFGQILAALFVLHLVIWMADRRQERKENERAARTFERSIWKDDEMND